MDELQALAVPAEYLDGSDGESAGLERDDVTGMVPLAAR
jgi:hypothetical protein